MVNYQSKPVSVNWSEELCPQIKKGNYKIPKFQREFVWSLEDAAKLIDSILKGYPIGTFITWKTKERFRSLKELGGQHFPEPIEGSEIYYILDGQQRLTSIYCSFKGLLIQKDKTNQDFSTLYIDLLAEPDEDIVKIKKKDVELEIFHVPLSLVADGKEGYLNKLKEFMRNDEDELCSKLDKYKQQIQTGYSFSVIQIENTPIEIATDMFTRINVSGKQLSMFEIMCAKTYIEETPEIKGFDLQMEYDEIMEKLRDKEFETIQSSAILQVVSAIITGRVDKKSTLSISRHEFRDMWPKCKEAIFKAVDFFRENLGVSASRILPYDSLIVPFSYFFFNSNTSPTGNTKSYLETIFWHTSLSEAYSGSSNEEISKDINRVKSILLGSKPEFYYTKAKLINKDKLRAEGDFKPAKSFIKAILCVFSLNHPKNIFTGGDVRLENDYLIQANSKQYHHFWPKNHLKKIGDKSNMENNIANIVIIDGQSNQKIGSKEPIEYLETCKMNNSDNFEEILKSNILPSFDEANDEYFKYCDFERFIEWRQDEIMNLVRNTIKILE
jgi:hypothetical protein